MSSPNRAQASRSSLHARTVALLLATGLVGTGMVHVGSAPVIAATGSELGRHVYGTGTMEDPVSETRVELKVNAAISDDGEVAGSYEITDYRGTRAGLVDCMFVSGSGAALGLGEWPDRQLVSIRDNGASGELVQLVPISHMVDGAEVADPHGLRVRRI